MQFQVVDAVSTVPPYGGIEFKLSNLETSFIRKKGQVESTALILNLSGALMKIICVSLKKKETEIGTMSLDYN